MSPAIERLRFLKEAFDGGLITAHEFDEHKRSVFRAIPALHDEMRGHAAPDGGMPSTPKEYELAFQRCIHSLVVLFERLLVNSVADPNGRSDAATSVNEASASIAHVAHFGSDANTSVVRADSRRSDDSSDYEGRDFAFDRRGGRPRGGCSMQNRRLELDPLDVNVEGLWTAEVAAANARREARQHDVHAAGSRSSLCGTTPLPRPAGRVYVRAPRNPPPNAAGCQRHQSRRQQAMAAIQVAPRRAHCRVHLNLCVN